MCSGKDYRIYKRLGDVTCVMKTKTKIPNIEVFINPSDRNGDIRFEESLRAIIPLLPLQ